MLRHLVATGVLSLAAVGAAQAADVFYPHAPAGSPVYQQTPMMTANIDVLGGVGFGSGTDAGGTGGIIGGISRVNFALHDVWNLQVDFEGSALSHTNSSDFNLDHINVAATAYLYKRSGGFAIGPFLSFQKQASGDIFEHLLGVYCGPLFGSWELHGFAQIGLLNTGNASGTTAGVQVGAQYWIDRNTEVGADVMYNTYSAGNFSKNVWTVAANALHRLAGYPIALFGQARLDSYSGATSATLGTVLVGARFYFNPSAPDALTDAETGPAVTTKLAMPSQL